QERDRSPQLPRRSASRTYRVVIAGNRRVHRLIAHSEDSTEATADWHSPLLARCRQPVRRDDGGCGQVPAVRHVVVEERLGEEGVDGRSQWIAADRPLVIEQYTDHPISRRSQENGRRTEQEFAGPKDRIVGGLMPPCPDYCRSFDRIPNLHS